MAEEITTESTRTTTRSTTKQVPIALTRTQHILPKDSGCSSQAPIPAKRTAINNNNDTTILNRNIGKTIKNQKLCSSRHQSSTKQQDEYFDDDDDNDDGERFLSISPDSATYAGEMQSTVSCSVSGVAALSSSSVCSCSNPAICVSLKDIMDSFKSPLSEEQAWALLYQSVKLYRGVGGTAKRRFFTDFEIPDTISNLSLHSDGSVHCSWSEGERLDHEREQQHQNGEHGDDNNSTTIASHKKILRKLGIIVYTALDYNLQADEQCQMSQELEELITYMTAEDADDDCIDEGIDEGYKRWDDESEDEKCNETKELDYVLEVCKNHVKPTVPEDHYKAVCRALVTETLELRIFLQQVLNDDTETLRLKADSQTSKQELAKLGFNDWARFWVQVIDELRRGVRLKKNNFSRTPIEFELTPYEILMEDIRSKKYQLRKVMVNGDIPPRVKKDAHALILEFIRSRPPLKKASERELPPPLKRTPSPREQLMDSIRKGRQLKHIQPPPQPRLKDRLLPPSATTATSSATASHHQTVEVLRRKEEKGEMQQSPRTKQRLIKVDFSLLQDDNLFDESPASGSSSIVIPSSSIGVCSQPKMPPYPIGGYMIKDATAVTAPTMVIPNTVASRVLRRTTYDLATQCESRRASIRRHSIVGCQSNLDETHSMPPSRPDSRQSDVNLIAAGTDGSSGTSNNRQAAPPPSKHQLQQNNNNNNSNNNISNSSNNSSQVQSPGSSSTRSSSSIGAWTKSFLDEKHWAERGDDRLSLTLEEIVHIRSVMTKAELEGLPVGVRVKEDVEKRKVCFLCLRTRFSIFGPWGIQCKLCQRTVCSKCYTKMRIPTEHFRNVPVVLISPSLLASPAGSSTPSPSHHAHINPTHSSSTGNILDETFPKSLIERLLRSESERKNRNYVGSAPSSPKHQRSNISTPGSMAPPPPAAAAHYHHHHHEIPQQPMIRSMIAAESSFTVASTSSNGIAPSGVNGYNKENTNSQQQLSCQNGSCAATSKQISIMSRSMEGPRSLPVHSPARPHSNSSTLDRNKSKFARAFTLSSSSHPGGADHQKENVRGELMAVCNDCEGLLLEIISSSKQTRSSARNRALKNLTLDLSPVYKC